MERGRKTPEFATGKPQGSWTELERKVLERAGLKDSRISLVKFVMRRGDEYVSWKECRYGCLPPKWEIGSEVVEPHSSTNYKDRIGLYTMGFDSLIIPYQGTDAALLVEMQQDDFLGIDYSAIKASKLKVLDVADNWYLDMIGVTSLRYVHALREISGQIGQARSWDEVAGIVAANRYINIPKD